MKKIAILKEVFIKSFTLKDIDFKGISDQDLIEEYRVDLNIFRLIPLSALCALYQILFIINDFIVQDIMKLDMIQSNYFYNEIFLGIISLITLLLCMNLYSNKEKSLRVKRGVFYFFYSCFGFSMLVYLYLDLQCSNTSATLFYIAIIYGIVPLFRKIEFFVFYLFFIISTLAIFIYSPMSSIIDVVDALFILFCLFFFSVYFSVNTISSKLKEIHSQNVAETDALTKVPNRHAIEQYLKNNRSSWVRDKRPIVFAMMDIDYFKHYNDTYLHSAGDEVLVQISDTIHRYLSNIQENAFFARYGGEEFVLIIEGCTDKARIEEIFEAIRSSVEELRITPGEDVPFQYVTISIGITQALVKKEIGRAHV